MHRRNESLSREVHSLLERNAALQTELSETREERDLSRAQLSSWEDEKKRWEDERNILETQLASGEEERRVLKTQLNVEEVGRMKAMAARDKLSEECSELQKKLESEGRLKAKFLEDCHAAVSGQSRAESMLKRERASIKKQRVEAIRRWQRRFLQEECLEYSCDLALMILQNCYNFCVPEGSDGPSFDEFAEPMVPTVLGLSLEEVRERAVEDRGPIPDEELDLSSVEEDESPGEENEPSGEGVPPAVPLGPAPVSDSSPAAEASPSADF